MKRFLNCTMPALVKSKVGSLRGTSGEDGTTVWPRSAKKSRNPERTSDRLFMGLLVAGGSNLVIAGLKRPWPTKNRRRPPAAGATRVAERRSAIKNKGRPVPEAPSAEELIAAAKQKSTRTGWRPIPLPPSAFSCLASTRFWPIWPALARIACSILSAISGLAARKVLAASRPWPMRLPS